MENKKQALRQLHEVIVQLLLDEEERDFSSEFSEVHSKDFKFELKYTSKTERNLRLVDKDED